MAVPRNALAYAGQHGEDASSANVVSLPLSTSIALSLAFDVSRLLEEMALNSRRSRARSLRSNQALLDAQRDARESTVDFVGTVRASKNSGNSENVCSLQVFGCLLSDLLLTSHQYLYFRLRSSHSSSPPASPPATRTCSRRSASLRFTSSRILIRPCIHDTGPIHRIAPWPLSEPAVPVDKDPVPEPAGAINIETRRVSAIDDVMAVDCVS